MKKSISRRHLVNVDSTVKIYPVENSFSTTFWLFHNLTCPGGLSAVGTLTTAAVTWICQEGSLNPYFLAQCRKLRPASTADSEKQWVRAVQKRPGEQQPGPHPRVRDLGSAGSQQRQPTAGLQPPVAASSQMHLFSDSLQPLVGLGIS